MTVHAEIDPAQLAAAKRKLETIGRPAMARVVERLAPVAESIARGNAPSDTGAIAGSLHAEVHDLEMRMRSTHPGALAVEFGRHSAQQPPLAAIVAWASRHGLADVAFPIARAIARRGIRGRFFLKKTVQQLHQSEIPKELKRAAAEIENEWKS